jgi:hypothetical protein
MSECWRDSSLKIADRAAVPRVLMQDLAHTPALFMTTVVIDDHFGDEQNIS